MQKPTNCFVNYYSHILLIQHKDYILIIEGYVCDMTEHCAMITKYTLP